MPDMNEQPAVLICALADAPHVVPGSVFDRHCTVCGWRVMVAPTGQRMLAQIDMLRIVCEHCFEGNVKPGDEFALPERWTVLDEARRPAQPAQERN
jgi:hypothetical protein